MKEELKLFALMLVNTLITVFTGTFCFASFYKPMEHGYDLIIVIMLGIILSAILIYLWAGIVIPKVIKYIKSCKGYI